MINRNRLSALIILLCFLQFNALAQSIPSIKGDVSVTTNFKDVFLNYGGPGITKKMKHIAFSVNMIPSLRFFNDKVIAANGYVTNRFKVAPTLGFGPSIVKNKFIISAPAYYLFGDKTWTFTIGIGYKIDKSK